MSTATRTRKNKPAARSRQSAAKRHEDRTKNLEVTASLVLARLSDIQRAVITRRLGLHDGHPADVADVASALGLSTFEVQRIEQQAIAHLRDTVGPDAAREMLAAC